MGFHESGMCCFNPGGAAQIIGGPTKWNVIRDQRQEVSFIRQTHEKQQRTALLKV